MKGKDNNVDLPAEQADNEEGADVEGYPLYPESEDIYRQSQREDNIDPEDISKTKALNENDKVGTGDENFFEDDRWFGDDLDVPGAELDDQKEDIGSEDEENNYYSLGGDDHNDLEEDKGE